MSTRTCLITGGAGFIGSHLATRLLTEGHKVVCLDNLSTGSEKNIAHLQGRERFMFVKGDANSRPELESIFRTHNPDTVFHYAAVMGVKRTLENPNLVLDDVNGINHLLDLCRKYGVKHAIYSSSSEVYGEPLALPEKEDGPLNAHEPYAVVKLYGEKRFKAYHQEFGMPTTSLRFFNVYGPRQDSTPYGFVTGIFIKQVLKGDQPTVFGDGSQTRDFVFIDDNVRAALAVLTAKDARGQIINIGAGRRTTILELAKTIIRLCGKDVEPAFLPHRPEYIMHRSPDVTKMREILGFSASTSLDEGLTKTIEWYRQNLRS